MALSLSLIPRAQPGRDEPDGEGQQSRLLAWVYHRIASVISSIPPAPMPTIAPIVVTDTVGDELEAERASPGKHAAGTEAVPFK